MLCVKSVFLLVSENVEFFAPSPGTVTLNVSTSTACVNIATAGLNGVVEVDKMFTVRLEAVEPSGITLSPSISQVTIEERDCKLMFCMHTCMHSVKAVESAVHLKMNEHRK